MCRKRTRSLVWTLLIIGGILLLDNDGARADNYEKMFNDLEVAPGCPIPDLRFSRPRKHDLITAEHPVDGSAHSASGASGGGSSDAAGVAENAGAAAGTAELTGSGQQHEVVRHSRYIDFDPYAFDAKKTLDPNVHASSQSASGTAAHKIRRRKIRSKSRQPKSATPSSPIIDDTTRHHHHHNTLSDEKIANQTDQTSHQSDDADDDAADEHTIQNSFQTGAGHPVIINDGARPENRTNDNAIDTNSSANSSAPTNSTSDMMRRVKRKSGKTTGALSRPKGASDSGSKSTSRKKDGATLDEEGLYIVHATDDSDDDEEDEEEEDDIEHDHFSEVTEVRFPTEIGPMGERKICRLRCVHGRWVGPICTSNVAKDEGEITADKTEVEAKTT